MIALLVIAIVTLATAAVAMALRNLIHSALLLIGSWAGVGAFYLWAGAEFVAFAQVLVYVGAVSMIVLFAVLLTRRSRQDLELTPDSVGRGMAALLSGAAVFGVLAGSIATVDWRTPAGAAPAGITVEQLGRQLMGAHLPAVLIAGVILTAALLGGLVLAASEVGRASARPSGSSPVVASSDPKAG